MQMSDISEALRAALSGRYDLDRVVGRGGMATVYSARDEKHNRLVGVKVLRPDLAASIGTERFLKEIEIAAQLNHPHIIPLYDSGEVGGFLYYVMPLIDGGSLRSLLNREGRLTPARAIAITTRVGDAVSYAHRQGVLHRDLKPENILFSEGHAMVADFGIARAISTAGGLNLTRTGFPLGTPGYMSPEQAAGLRNLDERTDVYSLACVCYEMLVGETPGMWPTEEAVRLGRFLDAPPRHRERLDALSGSIEQTLVRAMALRPIERIGGAEQFLNALHDAAGTKRMYSDSEVRSIVKHAAEMQVERPTEAGALSMGAVQQIAAQVGISPERVRQAAGEIDRRQSPSQWSWLSGAPTTLRVERFVAGEVPDTEFPALVEEIRATLRDVGNVSTLGRSLTWSTARFGQGPSARDIHITVSPRDGQTRILVDERLGQLAGGLFGGIVGGGGGGGGGAAIGILAGALQAPLLAVIGVSVAIGGSYLLARTIFQRAFSKRKREIDELLNRLAEHIAETARGGPDLSLTRRRGELNPNPRKHGG